MSLTNVLPWIQRAADEGWGVAAFNANTMEQAQAIVAGAEAERAPVIIQISHRAAVYAGDGEASRGLRFLAAVATLAANSVDVPVGLHVDHATEEEVLQALALGFTSVMFDGHRLALEENMAIAHRLTEAAHAAGAFMEGEIGEVPKPEVAEYDSDNLDLTTPEEAAAFVEATGVDLLAVAVGGVHGGRVKTGSLDLDRLEAINNRVDVPLVSHGSSGVSEENLAGGIKRGLAKVNYGTDMNKAFSAGVRDVLCVNDDVVDPRVYLSAGRRSQMSVVRQRLAFVGASGRVDER